MKINLEFYKEDEKNIITAEEKNVIQKYFSREEKDIEKFLSEDTTFNDAKIISNNRKNIISFYPIEKDDVVLEIGANFGELTEELCQKAKKVVSIESKKEKAEVIAKRYKDIENLEIIAGNFEEITFEEKFDYVVLIGNEPEKVNLLNKNLELVKKVLKDDGKILFTLDNKFGIKYWTGVKSDEKEKAYSTITGKTKVTVLDEIKNKLEANDFNTKVYYPIPDYTFTNAIYTDEFLPNVEHIDSREWEFFDEIINDVKFSEKKVLRELVKKDKNIFKFFVNSYFIVASKKEENIDIKAVTYGIFRKPEYKIKTVIKEKEVIKTANDVRAEAHILQIRKNIEILKENNINTLDRFENNSIISTYVKNGVSLDKCIRDLLKEDKKEEALNLIDNFKDNVLYRFSKIKDIEENVFTKYDIEISEEDLSELYFVRNGLYDLTFQNCFVIENEFYVYDQEWIEYNVPVEFILYRAIKNLPSINKYIDINELYEKYNITKFIKYFEKLEEKIEDMWKNKAFWNLHAKSFKSILENELNQDTREIEKVKMKEIQEKFDLEKASKDKLIYDKDVHIQNLEIMLKDKDITIENYEKQLQIISTSLSWKLTKPLRFISWTFNPFNGASLIDRIYPPGTQRRAKYDQNRIRKIKERKRKEYIKSTDEKGADYWLEIEDREGMKAFKGEQRKARGEWSDYEYWMSLNDASEETLKLQRKHKFKIRPKISIVIPLYNTPEDLFRELLFNMYRQTYTNWELCLADGSNEKLEYIQSMCRDPRIKYKFLNENKGISGNSNEGLKMVTGDYVALLDHDDLLTQDALFEMVKVINEKPNVRFIYTDEDKMTTIDKSRFEAHFKPDFSPDYLRGNNYICHFSLFKKEVMDKLEGFRDEYNGAQDLDIILRMSEIVKPEEIHHIPKILYHWRICETSTAGNPESKLYAYESGRKAVQHHIDRLGLKGTVERDPNMYGIYRVKYDILGNPKVNILIPNKNDVVEIKECINSIIEKTEYENYEIDIIDDNSNEEIVKEFYEEISKNEKVKIVYYNKKTSNYSKLINFGAKNTKGDFIVQLSNTSRIITTDWLNALLGYAQREDIGVVSGKVFAEDDTIAQSGVIFGGEKGKLDLNIGLSRNVFGYFAKECHVQNYSCVGINTMICKRDLFEKIKGLNEKINNFVDVDFCLSIKDLGVLNVYMPYAQVYDLAKKEENKDIEKDLEFIKEKWSKEYENGDEYYNKNFTFDSNRYEVRTDKVE